MIPITFVTPVGDYDVYEKHFLASPLFKRYPTSQIIAQQGFKSASHAYNNAIEKATNDIIVFAHQDVMFPANWSEDFMKELSKIEDSENQIGVVGCIGVTAEGNRAGHVYRHEREFFPRHRLPSRIETLDELLVSFRKSSGLRFDFDLPSFFFYGVDICLQAEAAGLTNFAVDVPCFHQAKNRNGVPEQFYECWSYIVLKWKKRLPINTLFGPIDGMGALRLHRLKNGLTHLVGKRTKKQWWEDLPKIDPEKLLWNFHSAQ